MTATLDLVCPEDCGHTDEDHAAFDAGVADGEQGIDLDVGQMRYSHSNYEWEAYTSGHSVGVINRENINLSTPDEDTP